MKVERMDGSRERRVLIGMIVDDLVLGRVAARWDGRLFDSPWANLVAGWCVEFHKKYGRAPRKGVESLFASWAERHVEDGETTQLVESFLGGLSDEYAELERDLNPEQVLDVAGEHFRYVRLDRLREALETNLEVMDLDRAEKATQEYSKVELGVGAGVNLFNDQEAVFSTFDEREESIIDYPGDRGLFFQGLLTRDSLVAVLGNKKAGKTFELMDLAWTAVSQRRRVAFFQVGDLSERQQKKRFLIRNACHPSRSPTGKWPLTVCWPVSMKVAWASGTPKGETRRKKARVRCEERVYKGPLSRSIAWEACELLMRQTVKSKRSYFRLSCHPTRSVSMSGIRSVLQGWAMDDWVPDVVVIDYADILAPITARREPRDQIDDTWADMRRLSQEMHCLVVTGTQANAKANEAYVLTREHVSEDTRKLAHVSGMFGVNMTPEEKREDVRRLNWVALREGDYDVERCLFVAGCLPVANPNILTSF